MRNAAEIISLLSSSEDERSPFLSSVKTCRSPIVILDSPSECQRSSVYDNNEDRENEKEDIFVDVVSDSLPSPLFHIARSVPASATISLSSSMYDFLRTSDKWDMFTACNPYLIREDWDLLLMVDERKRFTLQVVPYEVFIKSQFDFSVLPYSTRPSHIYILDKARYLQRTATARQRNFKKIVSTSSSSISSFNCAVNSEIDAIEDFENELLKQQLFNHHFPLLFYSETYPDCLSLIEKIAQNGADSVALSVEKQPTAPLMRCFRKSGSFKVDAENQKEVWRCWLGEVLGVSDALATEICKKIPTLFSALQLIEEGNGRNDTLLSAITDTLYKGKGISRTVAMRICRMITSVDGNEVIFQ